MLETTALISPSSNRCAYKKYIYIIHHIIGVLLLIKTKPKFGANNPRNIESHCTKCNAQECGA